MLDACITSRNMSPPPEDIAMDFMYGLDNARYLEFQVEYVNDLQKGSMKVKHIADLNKMYILASRCVVVRTGKEGGRGATFAITLIPTSRGGRSMPARTKVMVPKETTKGKPRN